MKHDDATIEGLEETLHSAQYALDKATGSRLKLENDFKIQVDNDAITINRLKNEGIDLKHSLADRNEEIARLRSTLSNLKYTVDLKNGDLAHLKDEFSINKTDNDELVGIADALDRDNKIECDMNDSLKSELDEALDKIRHLETEIVGFNSKLHNLENDNNHSRNVQDGLNREIDDVSAQLNILEGKPRNLKIDLDHIENSIGDLSGKNDAERVLFDNVRKDLDKEVERHSQLQDDYHRIVKAIEDGRRDLDDLRREVEDLNEKVRAVTSSNADLEYQIAELNRHIDVLTRQNKDINAEIHEILDLDKKVREELERRAAIAEKQKLNEENLLKSLSDLNMTRHSSPKR